MKKNNKKLNIKLTRNKSKKDALDRASRVTKINNEMSITDEEIINHNVKIVNLIGINILELKTKLFFEATDKILKVSSRNKTKFKLNNIPVKRGAIHLLNEKLPPKKDGTFYLVNTMVLKCIKMTYPERNDFVCPGPTPKNKKQHIIGCNGFFFDFEELDNYKI